jgi:hypothetical protein
MEVRMRWFAATIFAALVAATVPGAAWAETDVVLDNESSDTEVHTGESTFTNSDDTSVSSGTQFGERSDDQASTTAGTQNTGASVQGQAEAIQPAATQGSVPSTTTDTSSVPRSSADLILADADQTVSDFDALFVGLPISDGSVSS